MEHLQRTGLVDQATSPHKRARERLREKAEWVLGSRKGGKAAAGADGSHERTSRVQEVLERGGKAEGYASRTSGPASNLSPLAVSPLPVSSVAQPRTVRSIRTSLTRPRSISTSTTTSLASITSDAESETAEDAAVFSTLVAAFPRPPAIRVEAAKEKVTKLGLGALAESPLPSPPLSAASTVKGGDGFSRGMEAPRPRKERLGQAFELREKQEPARRPGPPTIPLPPIPPSPSPSLRPPRSSSIASSLTPPLSPAPTASSSSSPSPRKPSTNKPLPPLPPPPLALPPIPSREERERERDVQHLLERFAWPESPSRVRGVGRTAGSEESDESAVDARFGRGTSRTTSISTDDSESDSDESLRMENITAELSSLIDSFRPSAEQTPETSRPASTSPARAREKAQGERKASLASSVVSRISRGSRASSAWSSSGGSRAGQQENTTGGYRAYKLAREPSTTLLPSLSSSRLNRTHSSSSLASSTSSSASSDSEELFDLSLDSPPLERERERGWSWVSAARRKSSATSVETDGSLGSGIGAGVGGRVGTRTKKASEGDVEDEKEVLRQSLELANPQDAALDVSPIPPTRLRTLHTAKSTPSLRRPSTLRPPSMVRRHSDWDIDRINEEGQKPIIKEDAQTAQVEDKSKGLRPLFTASAATSPSRLPSPTTGRTRLPTAPTKDTRTPSISPVKTRPLLTSTNRSMLRPPTVRANTSPTLPTRTAPRPSLLAKRPPNLPLPATTSALPRPSASRLPLFGSSTASSIPQTAQKGLRRLSSLGTLAYIPSS
ncbi:hypothetical protein NBRC10512_000732 [Rhodotorula toruloides]|uniref:RHTO0S27e00408g1_1 n=2 Tax=Rhodotorula toruloides TaxID=5286 RepID=A0A061BJ90_RHOTO|nr:uncharacterized protein RHTO_07944 [Rhodotorula toruloides NP11]EMS22591.1 hypothetical protein RHTO_07944 [Rhodotorula toruloides NP11]CDR49472.1 RHTO0S27e00408g1_1 [Rhodotorula toruloides]